MSPPTTIAVTGCNGWTAGAMYSLRHLRGRRAVRRSTAGHQPLDTRRGEQGSMSLLERQQAQLANEAKAAVVTTAPPVAPSEPVEAFTPDAKAPARSRSVVREEMLHLIRVRLQQQVIHAFDALLDVKPVEIRTKIEGIIDRVIEEDGYAVTRDERLRLVQEMIDEIT